MVSDAPEGPEAVVTNGKINQDLLEEGNYHAQNNPIY
jgi:hypothetical protein